MPRPLEPWADPDTGTSSPNNDASTCLLADAQGSIRKSSANPDTFDVLNLPFAPKNDFVIINAGEKLARTLAQGDVLDFAKGIGKYFTEINGITDQKLLAHDTKVFVNALQSTYLTDIHTGRDANGMPTAFFGNDLSEVYVNKSFQLLDKYSTNPQSCTNYINPADTPQQAAANATLYVNKQLETQQKRLNADKGMDDESRKILMTIYGADFIADFNRRRLETNHLPDFIAHTDDNGKVEIVYQPPYDVEEPQHDVEVPSNKYWLQ